MTDVPKEAEGKRTEGLRARKKRETEGRITEAAIDLFLQRGYDATTLDEIAAAAGIARRTFFYYFKSKEAILLAFMDAGFVPSFPPLLFAKPDQASPFVAVRDSLFELFSSPDSERSLAVYKLLESTEALRSRVQAAPVDMENCVYGALCARWPEPEMRDAHRIVAAVTIAATRVAKAVWRRDEGRHPLAVYLREGFTALEKAIETTSGDSLAPTRNPNR